MKINVRLLVERTRQRVASVTKELDALQKELAEAKAKAEASTEEVRKLQIAFVKALAKDPSAIRTPSKHYEALLPLDKGRLSGQTLVIHSELEAARMNQERLAEALIQVERRAVPRIFGQGRGCHPNEAFTLEKNQRDLKELLSALDAMPPNGEVPISGKGLARIFPELL